MNIDDLLALLPETPSETPDADTAQDAAPFLPMSQRLDVWAAAHPARPAVVDDEGSLSYAELMTLSGAVAAFILKQGLAPETPVGVMTGRNRHHLAAVLGVWRAQCVSVPLDPALPGLRLQQMLTDCAAPLLLTDAAHAGQGERLSFACPRLRLLLCLDTPRFEDAVERTGDLMALELWEHVTQEAADGSWKSFFTGQPLAPTILTGMARNVCVKTDPAPSARILDIGGGSGEVARALMSRSGSYTSVELSHHELERVRNLGTALGIPVRTHVMEARDIGLLEPGFDLIVLNSVTENFPGCNYLRQVLDKAVDLLHPDGRLFAGMVWDNERREALGQALRAHAVATGDSAGLTRFEQGQELFIPQAVFTEWAAEREDVTLTFSSPASGLEELDAYRYDVLIRKVIGKVAGEKQRLPRHRFGLGDLRTVSAALPDTPPERAAYIIYTSGSTGTPKGVLVEHGPLMNLMDNLLEQVCAPLQAPIHAAQLASFSFDASLQSWATLCAGGTLFPVADELRRDPQNLHDFLLRRGITLCDGTPSLFGLLLDYWESHQRHPGVQSWLLGGETLRLDHLSRLYALPEQQATRVYNAYGPTECCVDATLYAITAANRQDHTAPPIGIPLKGVKTRVCDGAGRPVPEGIPGELRIGGMALARGYLHTPQHTAAAFPEQDGVRWYRTGDIVVSRNGLLFYLSREDGQVKTGGYRVETAEVETALEACPLVRQAVVTAGDFSGRDVTVLAAYIVPANGDRALDAAGLRAYLTNHLPAYAIPAFFIPMTSLPMTASGKVDRKSLPSPAVQKTAVQGRPPSSPAELTLATVWSGLLGVPVHDAEADFFALGGHSVLGVRLVSLIERDFGRRLPLSAVFSHPSIAAQARLLESPEQQDKGEPQILRLVQPHGPGIPLFLFHPAGGSAYCYRELADHLADSVSVYAVEPPPLLSRWPSMLSVEEMAVNYARGIAQELGTLPPGQPFWLGGWSFGGILAFETARLLRGKGLRERGMVILDTQLQRDDSDLIQLDEADFLLELLGDLHLDPDTLRAMSSEERIAYLLKEGQEEGRLPSGFDAPRMRALVRTFQYNALAATRYVPKPMDGKALLLRARLTTGIRGTTDDPYLGWQACLTGGVRLQWVPGSHESMLQTQNVGNVAEAIRACCGESA